MPINQLHRQETCFQIVCQEEAAQVSTTLAALIPGRRTGGRHTLALHDITGPCVRYGNSIAKPTLRESKTK